MSHLNEDTNGTCFVCNTTSKIKIVLILPTVTPSYVFHFKCKFSTTTKKKLFYKLKKLVVNVCNILFLTHKKIHIFILRNGEDI